MKVFLKQGTGENWIIINFCGKKVGEYLILSPKVAIEDLELYVKLSGCQLSPLAKKIFEDLEQICFKKNSYPWSLELLFVLISNIYKLRQIIDESGGNADLALDVIEKKMNEPAIVNYNGEYDTLPYSGKNSRFYFRGLIIDLCFKIIKIDSRSEINEIDLIQALLDYYDVVFPAYSSELLDKRLNTSSNTLSHILEMYEPALWVKFDTIREKLNILYLSSKIKTNYTNFIVPEKEKTAVLMLPKPSSVSKNPFFVIEQEDLLEDKDFQELIKLLYDVPEAKFYLFIKTGYNSGLFSKLTEIGILNEVSEYHFYKHPNIERDYIRLEENSIFFDWEKELIKTPMFTRIKLKLSERLKRRLEIEEKIVLEKELSKELFLDSPRLFIDNIDSFSEVRNISKDKIKSILKTNGRLEIEEDFIQKSLEEILSVPMHKKDWGGEENDLYTSNVVLNGKRISVAFALKGKGVSSSELQIKDCGKNGDQIVRLFQSPANLYVFQYIGEISENIIKDMENKTLLKRTLGIPSWYCVINGQDTARLLRAYKKI
jgi:hypothetical protein